MNLAPITILLGKNNTGKSALLKIIPFLQSALSEKSSQISGKEFNGVNICDEYKDLIYGKALKAASFAFKDSNNDDLKFSFFVENFGGDENTQVDTWELIDGLGNKMKYNFSDSSDKEIPEILGFQGVKPKFSYLNDDLWASGILENFKVNFDYISAIRSIPPLDFRVSKKNSNFISGKGEEAYDILINSLRDDSLYATVAKWYRENFDNWELFIDQSHAPVYHFLMRNKDLKVSLSESGTGVIQSLPIIVSAAYKRETTTVCVYEEPESHLHPAAHGALAEFIALQSTIQSNKRFLIETHSFNFILRIRTLVAEGVLNPEDIAIYYVYFDDETQVSKIDSIGVDSKGNVSFWPQNVFNESLSEVLRLRKAQNQL